MPEQDERRTGFLRIFCYGSLGGPLLVNLSPATIWHAGSRRQHKLRSSWGGLGLFFHPISGGLRLEVGVDEAVQVPVHDAVDVAGLVAGARTPRPSHAAGGLLLVLRFNHSVLPPFSSDFLFRFAGSGKKFGCFSQKALDKY